MSEPSKGLERWPGMCRKAAYGPSGFGSAHAPVEHDWRLHSRDQQFDTETIPQEGAPGYGNILFHPTGWKETWYCTRCRLVEERFTE